MWYENMGQLSSVLSQIMRLTDRQNSHC